MKSRYEINYLVYYNETRIQVIDHKLKRSYIHCIQTCESHYILGSMVTLYKSINKIIKYHGNNDATIAFKLEDNILLLEDPYYEYNFTDYKTIYDFENMMKHEQYVIKFIQWQQFLLIHVIDKFSMKCYMNASPINYFTHSIYRKIIDLIYSVYPVFIKKPNFGTNSLYMLYANIPITVKLHETTNTVFIDNMIRWYKERYSNNNMIEYTSLDRIFDYYLELPR